MPACDGGPWPVPDSSDAIDRQKIEFLAAYTHLNRARAELEKARATGTGVPEYAAVVERISTFRDHLEDIYAPIGFYAQPENAGEFAINLRFGHAPECIQENHRLGEPIEAVGKVSYPETKKYETVPGIPTETVKDDLKL